MARYFTSDSHFGHFNSETGRGIITFERYEFNSIQEHDAYLMKLGTNGSEKLHKDDEFWFLGDFGNLQNLWLFDLFNEKGVKTHFLLGNHDAAANIPQIRKYVEYVHQYPVFLSNKLVVSHDPVATYEDTINIHGHLHGSKLKDINHINASVYVTDYKMITEQNIAGVFSKLPKYNRRFLYEPYAADYVFTQPKEDVVMDRNGRVDLSASRLLMKLNKENPHEYKGGL